MRASQQPAVLACAAVLFYASIPLIVDEYELNDEVILSTFLWYASYGSIAWCYIKYLSRDETCPNADTDDVRLRSRLNNVISAFLDPFSVDAHNRSGAERLGSDEQSVPSGGAFAGEQFVAACLYVVHGSHGHQLDIFYLGYYFC